MIPSRVCSSTCAGFKLTFSFKASEWIMQLKGYTWMQIMIKQENMLRDRHTKVSHFWSARRTGLILAAESVRLFGFRVAILTSEMIFRFVRISWRAGNRENSNGFQKILILTRASIYGYRPLKAPFMTFSNPIKIIEKFTWKMFHFFADMNIISFVLLKKRTPSVRKRDGT